MLFYWNEVSSRNFRNFFQSSSKWKGRGLKNCLVLRSKETMVLCWSSSFGPFPFKGNGAFVGRDNKTICFINCVAEAN